MKSAAGIAATSASAWMGMERAAGIEYIDDAVTAPNLATAFAQP